MRRELSDLCLARNVILIVLLVVIKLISLFLRYGDTQILITCDAYVNLWPGSPNWKFSEHVYCGRLNAFLADNKI